MALLQKSLTPKDRVVITGATGWFGRTLALYVEKLQIPTLYLSSRKRKFQVAGLQLDAIDFDLAAVREFSPTFLVDLAFQTPKVMDFVGPERFVLENQSLISQGVEIFSQSSIQRAIFASSGAVTDVAHLRDPGKKLYAELKIYAEQSYSSAATRLGKRAVAMRPWSVSGGEANKPGHYAFADFLRQARSGIIRVEAETQVFRRYCSVEDLLAISFAEAESVADGFSIIESGGELIDLDSLARRIFHVLELRGEVVSRIRRDLLPDSYFSTNENWLQASRKFRFEPESLDGQIRRSFELLTSGLTS